MRSFAPAWHLRARVRSISIVESVGGEATVLPSESAVVGFQFRGRVKARAGLLSLAGVTGLQSQARTYAYQGSTASVLVHFTPEGAACLSVPAHELTDAHVPLDALFASSRVNELVERLHEAFDHRSRIALVEAFLGSLPFARDRRISAAIAALEQAPGRSVAGLAAELGLSERQLERRFLERVGLSPKRFARLRRFARAVELAPGAGKLSEVAQEAGYFDQSHFIRDFRRFTGKTPGEHLTLAPPGRERPRRPP